MLKAITVHTIHLNKIHASVTSYQTERERGGGYGAQHFCRGQLKCDGTCVETRFRLSAKQTSPFKTTRGGHQFSRLLAAKVCTSAVVTLDTPCSEVV